MVRNPWASYQKVATQTASPGQLVLMLFEGAIRFLDRAHEGFALEDPAERNTAIHNNVQRTLDILHELNMALDVSQGQLARTLRGLYEYMDRRLVESNVRKEEHGILEVRQRLAALREAWAGMLQQSGAENDSPPTPAAPSRAATKTAPALSFAPA